MISREHDAIPAISAAGLVLEPLTVAHAAAMFDVLVDGQIYRHLDYGPPSSVECLRGVYEQLAAGRSPDGSEIWLNWIVRIPGQPPMGFVQATVIPDNRAWVAYVLSSRHWGKGHAFAATRAMLGHLEDARGITRFLASVEGENRRSIGLLERLSFRLARPDEAQGYELTESERLYVRSRPARHSTA